jgi:hypothetical protein
MTLIDTGPSGPSGYAVGILNTAVMRIRTTSTVLTHCSGPSSWYEGSYKRGESDGRHRGSKESRIHTTILNLENRRRSLKSYIFVNGERTSLGRSTHSCRPLGSGAPLACTGISACMMPLPAHIHWTPPVSGTDDKLQLSSGGGHTDQWSPCVQQNLRVGLNYGKVNVWRLVKC